MIVQQIIVRDVKKVLSHCRQYQTSCKYHKLSFKIAVYPNTRKVNRRWVFMFHFDKQIVLK